MTILKIAKPLIATALAFSLLTTAASGDEKKETLTIEEAKFQMLQLYTAEKIPTTRLSTKYPELRKADKASRAASKEFRDAAQAHPQLKERFDKLNRTKISIPAKMKLWQPLFAEAEKIKDLEGVRRKYHQARVHALKVEIEAHQSEGHTDLAHQLKAIFSRIKPLPPLKGE